MEDELGDIVPVHRVSQEETDRMLEKLEGEKGGDVRLMAEFEKGLDETRERIAKIREKGEVYISTIELYGEDVTNEDYYNYTESTFHLLTTPNATKDQLDSLWNELTAKYGKPVKSPKKSSKSQYIIDKSTGDVYRYSDHWGKAATCLWKIDQPFQGVTGIAKANLKDFKRISKSVINPEYIELNNHMKQLRAGMVYTDGSFGQVYTEYAGKPEEAIARLIEDKDGVAVGVFHDDKIGDIDIVYGDYPTGINGLEIDNIGEGKAFATIKDAADDIKHAISYGESIKNNADRQKYKDGGITVNIGKKIRDKEGVILATKNWVINIKVSEKKEVPPRGTLTTPSSNHTADGVLLPSSGNSFGGKVTNNSGNNQIKTEKTMRRPDGTLYGWVQNGEIYLTPQGINPNSPIHEYGHLWGEYVRRENPELWASVVENMKQSPIWDEVVNSEGYEELKAASSLLRLDGRPFIHLYHEREKKPNSLVSRGWALWFLWRGGTMGQTFVYNK